MNPRLLLVDGNSIANRAFFSSPNLTNAQGMRIGTTLTFFQILLRYIRTFQITHMAFAFDLPDQTFRHQLYPEYKSNRSAPDPHLIEDIRQIRELLQNMQIPIYTLSGFEADDVVGTLSRQAGPDTHVYLLSGDRDYLQLVSESVTQLFPQAKGQYTEYTLQRLQEEFHCTPKQFIDYKALQGDSSDHVPGLDKVGPTTARKWLEWYPDIDSLYAHFSELPISAQRKLEGKQEFLKLMQELVRIRLDLPLVLDWEAAALDGEKLEQVQLQLAALGGYQLSEKYADWRREQIVCAQEQAQEESQTASSAEQWEQKALPATWDWILNQGTVALVEPCEPSFCWIADSRAQAFYRLPREKMHLLEEQLRVHQAHLLLFSLRPFWLQGWTWDLNVCLDLQLLHYLQGCSTDCQTLIDLVEAEGLPLPSLDRKEVLPQTLQALYLQRLAPVVTQVLRDPALKDLYWNLDLPLLPILVSMQQEGVGMNATLLAQAEEAFGREVVEWEQQIHNYAGHVFNISSPKQLAQVLYEELQLPTGKTKKSKPTTNADWLEQIRPLHPIVGAVLEYRQVRKLLTTYVQGLQSCLEEGNRIHSQFLQTTTNTARLSSIKPNLQNLPIRRSAGRIFREAVQARPGWVLIDADYSQIELRLLAHLSQEPALVHAFQNGIDVHALTAAQIFGVDVSEVSSEQRAQGKIINFSIIYGITPFGLSQDLGGTVGEAKEYIDRYFQRYPGVQSYLEEVVRVAKETGKIQTLYGRQREIPELLSTKRPEQEFGQRAAKNAPIQGAAADLMRHAMLRVQRRIQAEGLQARLILQIHDELILEAPQSEQERAKTLLREEMEQAATLLVPLEVDVGVGHNWLEAKA